MAEHRPSDATVVCPHCFAPNEPGVHFCHACGGTLTSHATIDPVLHIRAEGDTYQSAINEPRKPIILIGMWLIFGPLALSMILVIVVLAKDAFDPNVPSGINGPKDVAAFVFCVILIVLLAAYPSIVLFRTTRNFFRLRRSPRE